MKKATQIKMIRGALASKKTPKQFLPSLRRRLANLTAVVAILFVLCGWSAKPVAAQTPVILQPYQQTLATNATCTGSAQTFKINNRNQTQHNVSFTSNAVSGVLEIDGLDTAGNTYRISDVASMPYSSMAVANPILVGYGYYPTVEVVLTCAPNTAQFSLNYSGGSIGAIPSLGSSLLAQIDKSIALTAPAASGLSESLQTPFGSSLGTVFFTYSTTGPSGSSIIVSCAGGVTAVGLKTMTYALGTSGALQSFKIPDTSCPSFSIAYVSGGASVVTYSLEYVFAEPPFRLTNSYSHITATTATTVKAGPGVLQNVVIGTPAAGTLSFFDLAPAACTGTPSTNVVSVITVTTSTPPPVPFATLFNNGICAQASATMDITVGYQ